MMSESVRSYGESYYLGCWQEAGHFFFAPGLARHVYPSPTPWHGNLDSRDFADSRDWLRKELDGWTAIGRRDNTVDSRPGSHSTFAFHAVLTTAEAEAEARRLFPEIFERIEHKGK
jgi:hypothetical protein